MVSLFFHVYFSIKTKGGFELGYGYEFTQGEISDVITNPTHEIMIKVPLGKKIQDSQTPYHVYGGQQDNSCLLKYQTLIYF